MIKRSEQFIQEQTRGRLIALFQVLDKPGSSPMANLGSCNSGRPGSKPLLPDFYSSGALPAIKALPDAPWLFFAYHPETAQCPSALALQILTDAVPELHSYQLSRRKRLANLALVAAMDVRQQALVGDRCTIKLICQLAGVYLHNWQRDYRDHYSQLLTAATIMDKRALSSAAQVLYISDTTKNVITLE